MKTTTRILFAVASLCPLIGFASCSDGADAKTSMESGKQPGDVRPVDLMITERVRYALQEEKATAGELAGVGISTVDGVVTLTGSVSSAAVRDRFYVVTKAVGSVTRVDNKLTIK